MVGSLVYCLPESPRWFLEKTDFVRAFESSRQLRHTDIQATRDIYIAYKFLQIEDRGKEGRKTGEFFTVRRNRRVAQSAWFCMFA